MFFAAVIVVVWQLAASWRARMSVAREEAYRKLAEEVVAAQRQTSQALEQTAAELVELRARTAEVERVLKEVG
jgi:type VI protein secretion system component VasK